MEVAEREAGRPKKCITTGGEGRMERHSLSEIVEGEGKGEAEYQREEAAKREHTLMEGGKTEVTGDTSA